MTDYAGIDAAAKAFDDNSLQSCDNETLQKHLIALANELVPNVNVQQRNIIRGITINHILLQRHIDSLEKRSAKIQCWVIALAVASLISSVLQIFSPMLFQHESAATLLPKSILQSGIDAKSRYQLPSNYPISK